MFLATLAAGAFGAASAAAGTEHTYLGHSFGPHGLGAGSFANVQGLAVDESTGDVYVYDSGVGGGAIYKFASTGEPAAFSGLGADLIEGAGGGGSAENQIAVDNSTAGSAKGDIYVANGESGQVRVYSSAGVFLGEVNQSLATPLSGGEPCGIAVDPTGDLYVDYFSGHVDKYTATDNLPADDVFDEQLDGPEGTCNIAADSHGAIYTDAWNEGQNKAITKYEASQLGSSSPTGALLASGRTLTVDPLTDDVYVDQGEGIAQYDFAGELLDDFGTLNGSSGVAMNGATSGPGAGNVYVANAAAENRVEIYVPPIAPVVNGESVAEVAATSATLQAQVTPGGADTTYHFEYGTSASYGNYAPVPDGDLGSNGSQPSSASHAIQGLAPETIYHYRIVATSKIGTAFGLDQSFTTQAASGQFALPDGRQYEMVSPPEKDGALITGYGAYSGGGMIQAAADGSEIVYFTYSPFAEPKGNGNGSQILSVSNSQGSWSSQDISTPHSAATGLPLGFGTEYKAFSEDLSYGFLLQDQGTPLSSSAPLNTRYTYLRDDITDSYMPLEYGAGLAGGFVGGTPDLSHVLLLTSGESSSNGVALENLYEWSNGQRQQVNILPNGSIGYPGFGYQYNEGENEGVAPNSAHEISTDGSLVIWNNRTSVYERNMITHTTITIPGIGLFVAASPDGSEVFGYQKAAGELGDFYEYDIADGQSTDLSGGATSSDGSYLSTLPGGVQVLHYSDSEGPGAFDLVLGASRVSPDGRFVVFDSTAQLTSYDNIDTLSGEPDDEVYEYDSSTAHLTCVSCDPSGARPIGGSSIPGTTPFGRGEGNYYSRALSSDGRVFFDSSDALVAHDTDGVQDVYEFEPAGVGTCQKSGGCISLISSGISREKSTFLDASADGSDVFFLTSDQLVSKDYDHSTDVYDAHICSGQAPCPAVEPASPPACSSSDACKAAPTPQPLSFGPPASATFSGAGNPAAPTSTKASTKKVVKKKHKKQKSQKTKRSKKSKSKGRK